jgi:hypothetical protein
MSDTKVDKTKGVPQGVVASQLKVLKEHEKFGAKVAKYAPPNAVVKAEVISSKGHSPIKYTVMVPVHVVPSQPLPGPAATSTKPTPPPVPPKPVTFSGSASSAAKTNPAFMAKMNATIAATAATRKTASVS